MKSLALGLVLLATLAACASTPTVHTDSDPGAQFSQYRTYTWLAKPEGVSPLAQERIIAAVDAQLQAKGWTQAPNGDVGVAAHVATEQRHDIDTFYSGPGWGGWGWYGMGGMGSASTTVRTYKVGTLVVDMFDTKTKKAIWRGTASDTIPSSPEKANAIAQAGITKMFESFPPGSAPAK